jgi:hypothetical protein
MRPNSIKILLTWPLGLALPTTKNATMIFLLGEKSKLEGICIVTYFLQWATAETNDRRLGIVLKDVLLIIKTRCARL